MGEQYLDVVIVGAGFSGIAAAIERKKLGYDDIVIVEREDDRGGTSYENRCCGAAADLFSTTYHVATGAALKLGL